MFEYLKGTLAFSSSKEAVIDVHGVGYKVLVGQNTFSRLPQLGQEIVLYLSYVVREDSHTLFGFLTKEERDIYEILLGLHGIGPKTALGILGTLTIADLSAAVGQGDFRLLGKIPGIGKKTAERLIVDLQGKLPAWAGMQQSEMIPSTSKIRDAMQALINLGYHQAIAQKALKKALGEVPETADLSALIGSALRQAAQLKN